jgi:hypothetical protein
MSKYICPYKEYTSDFDILKVLKDKKAKINIPISISPTLIGSRALRTFFPSYKSLGSVKDYDLITDIDTAIKFLPQNPRAYPISFSYSNMIDYNKKNNPLNYKSAILTVIQITDDFELFKLYIFQDTGNNLDIEIVTNINQSGYLIATYKNDQKLIIEPHLQVNVANLEVLEIIKTSHIYHPHSFSKHIKDVHAIRRLMSICSIKSDSDIAFIQDDNKVGKVLIRSDEINSILKIRSDEIDKIKGIPAEKVNLMMSNDDFLEKDGNLLVEKMIKHDDIHELVKFNDNPLYMKLKTDQSKALCLKKLWDKLTYNEQLQDVMEEAMVLALERYLLRGLHICTNKNMYNHH